MSGESLESQINRLASYLIREWGDHPSWEVDETCPGGKGAVDLAIAILEQSKPIVRKIEDDPTPKWCGEVYWDNGRTLKGKTGDWTGFSLMDALADQCGVSLDDEGDCSSLADELGGEPDKVQYSGRHVWGFPEHMLEAHQISFEDACRMEPQEVCDAIEDYANRLDNIEMYIGRASFVIPRGSIVAPDLNDPPPKTSEHVVINDPLRKFER